jgi:hypothetical protein
VSLDDEVARNVTQYRRAALRRPDSHKAMRCYRALESMVRALMRRCYDEAGEEIPWRYR